MQTHIIFIDNFDSFSYNLVDEFKVLGNTVEVYRNDIDSERILEIASGKEKTGKAVMLVLSPGPSAPKDANNLLPIIRSCLGKYPMLGICLGHQALGEVLGGQVVRAEQIVHGKASLIEHDGTLAFANLPSPLRIARYHSLVVRDLPAAVQITSQTEGMTMSFYSAEHRVMGLQFHPESVLTTYGRTLLKNAIRVLTQN